MTRYTGNEPIEPFVVMAKTVKCSVENGEKASAGGGGGGIANGKLPAKKPSALDLEELDSAAGKIAVGGLLGAAFLLVSTHPILCQITIFILPLVVMYRLDSRRRQIAAAPVIVAAMMLAGKIVGGGSGYVSNTYGVPPSASNINELRIWMPMFLAGCLFYMPRFSTYTEKILLVLSLLLLLSGLLPGDGFVVIFMTTQYFLFIAIAIGLGIDLTQNGRMFTADTSSTGR